MKTSLPCITCAIDSFVQLAEKGMIPADKHEEAMRRLLSFLSQMDYAQGPPWLGKEMHALIREVSQNPDPYKSLKQQFNSEMLGMYPEFKRLVTQSSNPFNTALRLAIAGNIIDFGPNHRFDHHKTISRVLNAELALDDSTVLQQEIQRAQTLLYLGDNAGEIVFDRLFLETIDHPDVWFAVRGSAIINDALEEDAREVGIANLATIISNGDNAPGTILENTSETFQELFNRADLVIAKGQGNFESLNQVNKKIFFLLMIKCDQVAKVVGVPKGSYVVMQNQSYQF